MSIRGTRFPVFAIAILLACSALLAPAQAHALNRTDVIKRAKVWVGVKVPYSQTRYASEAGVLVTATPAASYGYRTDCSGFVSMALGLKTRSSTPLSLDTGSLPFWLVRTTKSSLVPGDVILRPKTLVIGGKTVPYGHAVIFGGWANTSKTYYWGLHESSSAKGAVRAKIRWGTSGFYGERGFAPYRVPRIDERPRIEPKF